MITEVTTSMLRCFKECRRRYKYEYIDLLKPVDRPKALEIGTLYHRMLEQYVTEGNIDIQLSAHEEVDEFNFAIAQAMATAYIEWIKDQGLEFIEVELPFIVSVGYGKRLKGKIDAVVERDGEYFLVEHKTTSQYNEEYLQSLMLDEQPTNYLFAFNKLIDHAELAGMDKKAVGMFYLIVEKPTIKPFKATPLEQRKYKKDGSLYANQREFDESLDDFKSRLAKWYAEEERIHRHFIYRKPNELSERIEDLQLQIKDLIRAEADGTYYRNPASCKVFGCPYRALCVADDPKKFIDLYTTKTKRNEEL